MDKSSFCDDIDRYFLNSKEIIKDKRNVIKVIDYKGDKLVVKSFKIPNLINRFVYRFIRSSKAKRSYQNGLKLLNLGINTPKPICYKENFTPLLKESYYVCEFFDYDFEIRDVLIDARFKDREEILREFVAFSYELHQKGIYHIDYSPGNVLIKRDGERLIFNLVDLNRMKFIDFSDDLRFKNLSRFSASDNDTKIIAKEYAKISNIDEKFAQERLFFYHNRHQEYIKNKRRLKYKKRS
jgi:serine/threonine protein kinase